jgi:hypothetical protein
MRTSRKISAGCWGLAVWQFGKSVWTWGEEDYKTKKS